jgi:glutamyl-tRNA reductase
LPLLTRDLLEPLVTARIDRPLFIIDIAVPRDIAPDVNEMSGVYLYDIDSLRSVAEQSLALRRQQIAAGDAIIAEHVDDFREWFASAKSRPHSASSAQLDVADGSLRPSES